MSPSHNICSLDYLIGTLATAYKGVITSLAAKDFCMAEEGGLATLTGTVLAMPAGDYEVSLIRSGVELARASLHEGSFELSAESGRVRNARDLQLDLTQSGRHIGSFLLKRENADGLYLSAVELSDELKDMDFKRLTGPLREKAGLLQKAEDVISSILSTKKDWNAFSEKINGFSIDLFWSVRDAFYGSFPMLVHFSRLAAERSGNAHTSKPASNLLDSLELPLQHEADPIKLRSVVDVWLREMNEARANFTPHVRRTVVVLASIHEKFPDTELGPILKNILGMVRAKTAKMPLFNESALRSIKDFLQSDDYALLNNYVGTGRQHFLKQLSETERFLEEKNYQKVLAAFAGLNPELIDNEKMVSAFFDVIDRSFRKDSVGPLINTLVELFSLLPGMSGRALESVHQNVPRIMHTLIKLGKVDACFSLLDRLHQTKPGLREELLMNPGIARSILESASDELIRYYCTLLTQLLIPSAKISGLSTDTWAELVDPRHLERLSKFLDILQLGGERLLDALIHVTANLYVSGVFIPDDKLFQRKVSAYLNSGVMRENPLPNYLLLKKLPVYFNDVGAVSVIRDYSTELDSWGDDPALYFLRKQVHVNASNFNVPLIEKIIRSWVNGDPALLQEALPRDVYDTLKPALWERYSVVIKPFLESLGALDNTGLRLEKLLSASEASIQGPLHPGNDEMRAKVMLLCKLYRELVKKYSFLSRDFDRANPYAALSATLEQIKALNRTVLSPEKTAARESLYFKRHIAFGIPSVLGSYYEPKFDALGELLRREAKMQVLLEEVISGINVKDPVAPEETIQGIAALIAAYELLVLRGFRNAQIDELIVILNKSALRLSQVADLLKTWRKELTWMVERFNRTFLGPLTNILKLYPREALPDTLVNLDPEGSAFEPKAADIILRDMINDVPGLVESDRLIEGLLSALVRRIERGLDDELNADVSGEDSNFFALPDLSDEEAMKLAPLLGGKAKNLVYLRNRGFLVPPGCVLSSLHTNQYRSYTEGPEFLSVLKQAVRNIEKETGTIYGGNEKPLFLSVRSGSYASMPGILSSLLYCGMNEQTIEAFIRETGDARLAWDSYRRFMEHYGMVVLGLESSLFENIRDAFMKKLGAADGDALGPDRLKELTGLYNEELSRRGLRIPGDVYEQLRLSIQAVYASWFSKRARQFRKTVALSGQWGTAVALMQMVYGNTTGSGTSVLFTRNPFTYEQEIYGETRENATGDDLVYGKQRNRPLAKNQTAGNGKSLEEVDPELFRQHHDLARKIEDAMGGLPQEVEVTYTKGQDGTRTLFVLQTRRMEFGGAFIGTFDEICRMESRVIGRGAGAHGGALSGAASFASSPDQVEHVREKTGLPVILIRKTANTDDVSLMSSVRGLITATGGVTSHAAVLAQKFGITAITACTSLSLHLDRGTGPYATFGDTVIREGDLISMDGATGLVFSGTCLTSFKNGSKKIATKSPRH